MARRFPGSCRALVARFAGAFIGATRNMNSNAACQLEIMSWNVLTRTMMGGMEGSFRLGTTPKNTVRISTMDKAKNIKYIGNETIKSTLSGKGQLTSRHSYWFNFSMYYFILKLLSRNTKLKRMQNLEKLLCLGITPTILIGFSFECGMKISF